MSLPLAAPTFEDVTDVVREFCARPVEAAGTAVLEQRLVQKRALINRLELDFARDAAVFAQTYDDELSDMPSPVSWMREHCHMTSVAAATAITVGENAGRLQLSSAALVDGRIGYAHLGVMSYTAEAVDRAPAERVAFNEAQLVAKAEVLSVQRFRTLCGHVRHAADREAFLQAQESDARFRSVEVTTCSEGGVSISGWLDAEGGALLCAALEPLTAKGGAEEQRPAGRRCADALVELCSYSLDHGLVPQRASQRAHLQVTTTLETLRDVVGAPAGEMEGGHLLAGATVQRLACDSTITRVLVSAASAVVDVGRSQRVVAGATRRALNVRDQGCSWPGCDRPPSRCAAHHVVHWARHGRTDLDNLVLLCRRHHWAVHEGGRELVRRDDGSVSVVPWLPGPNRDGLIAVESG